MISPLHLVILDDAGWCLPCPKAICPSTYAFRDGLPLPCLLLEVWDSAGMLWVFWGGRKRRETHLDSLCQPLPVARQLFNMTCWHWWDALHSCLCWHFSHTGDIAGSSWRLKCIQMEEPFWVCSPAFGRGCCLGLCWTLRCWVYQVGLMWWVHSQSPADGPSLMASDLCLWFYLNKQSSLQQSNMQIESLCGKKKYTKLSHCCLWCWEYWQTEQRNCLGVNTESSVSLSNTTQREIQRHYNNINQLYGNVNGWNLE